MKTLLHILAAILLVSSCRSIEKMVDQGRYDEAIVFATKKLAGKKNKKTKHVKGLEEAFFKITQRDLDALARLDSKYNPHTWESALNIIQNMDRRQRKIDRFLPLVSKDGYRGAFEFIDTKSLEAEAIAGAAEYHYSEGSRYLAEAKHIKDKLLARKAFDHFTRVAGYKRDYKDTYEKENEAKDFGTVHIKINTAIESSDFIPSALIPNFSMTHFTEMNGFWKKFHLADTPITADYSATLAIKTLDVSPERETITHHSDEKKIKDGYKYLRDKNGKIKRDTSGKKLKKAKFKLVRAQVTEILREKATYVGGELQLINKEGQTLERIPLSVEALFSDYASTYHGDRRALCAHDIDRIKDYPRSFPLDGEMITDASSLLKHKFIDAIHDLRI